MIDFRLRPRPPIEFSICPYLPIYLRLVPQSKLYVHIANQSQSQLPYMFVASDLLKFLYYIWHRFMSLAGNYNLVNDEFLPAEFVQAEVTVTLVW